jgi:hypothetical protein
MKKIFFITSMIILCCVFSCKKDDSPVKDKDLTYEKLKGNWYLIEKSNDISILMSIDFISSDTSHISFYNGPEELVLMTFIYSYSNGHLVMTPVTGNEEQNSLQIMITSDMDFIALSDEAYLEDNKLVFVEGNETFKLTRDIPKISGGSITGDISVTGNFGRGTVMIAAIDPNTEKGGITFRNSPGKYYCQGLANGSYYVLAVYIPIEHASDYQSHELTEFPYDTYLSQISISSGKTVSGINLDISLPVDTKSRIKKSGQINEILWKKMKEFKIHNSSK